MTQLAKPITSVRLARDRRRLYAAPVVLLLVAAGAAAGAFLLRGPAGISLAAIGAIAGLLGLYLMALVSSYRLLVEPGVVHLRWLGGERRYRLARGPVTRVAVAGEGSAVLRPRFGALGWAVGPALLRGDEQIELIRLSRRPPLIVVPTDRGRLAIVAAVEADLLAALAHAVRLQERVDEVAARRAAPPPATAAPAAPLAPPAPRVLTGIERTLIEQRLAAERAAALAAAEAGKPAPVTPALMEAAAPVEPAPVPAVPAPLIAPPTVSARTVRRRQRAHWLRPAWLAVPGPASVVAALPMALPLLGAGVAWITVAITGRPVLPADEARLLLAAIVLAGPVGALGAFIARTWYPRLGGLVTASSIAAFALLARTILA